MRISDWSSDVCSSDLVGATRLVGPAPRDDLRDQRGAAIRFSLLQSQIGPHHELVRSQRGAPVAEGEGGCGHLAILPAAQVDDADPGEAAGHVGTVSSEEHTSELQSLMRTSYAVFCLKK